MADLFGIDAFERPALLVLGLAVACATTWLAARQRAPALAWPAFDEALAAGATRIDAARLLALATRAGALVLLALALGGPVREHAAPPPPGEGLDLVLVLDASDSMLALDAEVDGVWRTRLDLARQVVTRFAEQRVAAGDRVGLVVFGEHAFTQSPLASDGRLLAAALERVAPRVAGSATALGDALALAVKRASGARSEPKASEVHRDGARSPQGDEVAAQRAERERSPPGPNASEVQQVVVLLTDGRSNAGAVPVDVATALARARGVRVHTVGIGGSGDVAMQRPPGAGRGLHFERHDLDADTLAAIADTTGGRFFAARSSADLGAVYAAIDALERVPRRAPPRRHRTAHPAPFLAGALLLVTIEIATVRGIARRLP